MKLSNLVPLKYQADTQWAKDAQAVRAKHPGAALRGRWRHEEFLGWVVVASNGAALSEVHQDDEAAWADARRKV